MRDMRACHQETFVADDCLAATCHGAGVDGRMFADDAIGADADGGILALIPKMLRRTAEHREGIDDGARTDRRSTIDNDMRFKLDAFRQRRAGRYAAPRPDGDAVGDRGSVFNDCSRMNSHKSVARPQAICASMAADVASATSLPLTVASPSNRQTGGRRCAVETLIS